MAKPSRLDVVSLLQGADTPLYLLSPERRIVFVNRACEQLLGQPAERLVGLRCNYHSTFSSEVLAALSCSLCPPPATMDGAAGEAVVALMVAPECFVQRRIVWWPSHDAAGRLTGVLGIILDDKAQTQTDTAAQRPLQEDWHKRLAALRRGLAENYGFDQIVCRSAAMQTVLDQVKLAADCDLPVLVCGEPGAGKELIARTIHYASSRRDAPLVPLDCVALPAEVLQRTLQRLLLSSGPEPQYWRGLSLAGGTLLVQEVTALPRDAQAQIEQHWTADRDDRTSIRLIATTSRDIRAAWNEGHLREPLYRALQTLVTTVPPLRERRDDVPLLAQHFLEQQNARGELQVGTIDADALEVLQTYDWPGNVRELALALAEAHSRASGPRLRLSDLPLRLRSAVDAALQGPARYDQPIDLDAVLTATEATLIRRALSRARGKKSRAAHLLGISRPRLYRRMEQLRIEEHSVSDE